MYLVWKCAFGEGAFFQSLSPTEPLTQLLLHEVYAEWSVPTILAKIYLRSELLQGTLQSPKPKTEHISPVVLVLVLVSV